MTEHNYEPQRGKPPWDSLTFIPLFAILLFLGICILGILASLNPNLSQQNNPPPPPILFVFFGLILFPGLFQLVQRILGVSYYSIDETGLTIHHRIGETRITFNDVEYARKDSLNSYIPRGPKNSRGDLRFELNVETEDFKWTGNFYGMLFSVREGECVVLKLKDEDSRVVLTPDMTDEMINDLKVHGVSGGDVVFQRGIHDAINAKLRRDQISDILVRVSEDQLQLVEGICESILEKLERDSDYRAGYVEGLKSLLSTVKVRDEENEIYKLEGLSKKLRL